MAQAEYKNLSTSCNEFAKSFYKELSVENKENIVCSPFSVHTILSLLSHGAENTTLQEFTDTLHHYNKDSLKSNYKSLLSLLNEVEGVKLYIANIMYLQENFNILAEFLNIAEDYQSQISKVNFKDNIQVAGKINSWVEERTNKKISNLISADNLDESTMLVLVNAIYFNGEWLEKFNVRNTQNKVFHVSRTEKKHVPTMFNKFNYNYGEIPVLNAKFIEIPYRNNDIVMIIILPNEVDGLSHVENNFSWAIFENIEKHNRHIELYLPRFNIEFTVDLQNLLCKLGLNRMFEDLAEFGKISDVPLTVSKVIHKTMIEVNEEGTEAAAATCAQIRLRRMFVMPEEFVVDRPFMFIIEHVPSKIPLFIGNVKDIQISPKKDEL